MFIISHNHDIIYNQSLLSPVIMACKILWNRIIYGKNEIVLMAFDRKFSQEFQEMRTRIFTERFKIDIDAVHSDIGCCLHQMLNDILSGSKL